MFEEAMAALMDAMPPSPSGSEEADELENELGAPSFSEIASTDAETVSPNHTQHENAEKPSASKAAHNTSTEVKPGCQRCDWVFVSEYEAIKVMQAAKPLGLGSTAYFDPSQVARGKFLKGIINSFKDQGWIGLDSEDEGGFRVLDYAAGTGILNQALAPHATEILAIDKSREMVEEYNKIVAKENRTKCEMRAVQGDMTSHFLSGKKAGIENPDGVFAGFDMVAMCLAVDFFTHEGIPEDLKHKQLVKALDVMVNLIDEDGTLLIIDIEKCDKSSSKAAASHSPGFLHEGLKVTGHGSKDIAKVLEELGIKEFAILGDQQLLFEAKLGSGPDPPTIMRKDSYFVVKARRGALPEKRLF